MVIHHNGIFPVTEAVSGKPKSCAGKEYYIKGALGALGTLGVSIGLSPWGGIDS